MRLNINDVQYGIERHPSHIVSMQNANNWLLNNQPI